MLTLVLLLSTGATLLAETVHGRIDQGKNLRALAVQDGRQIQNTGSTTAFQFDVTPGVPFALVMQDTSNGKLVASAVAGVKLRGLSEVVSYRKALRNSLKKRSGAQGFTELMVKSDQSLQVGEVQTKSVGEVKTPFVSASLRKANLASGSRTDLQKSTLKLTYGGSFGYNLSSQRRLTLAPRIQAEADDQDDDGFLDVTDIDDDGDGIIDGYDTNTSNDPNVPEGAQLFSNLKVTIEQSLNYNANSAITQSQVDELVRSNLTLAIPVSSDGIVSTSELDCTGLSYCSLGGTGRPVSSVQVFPDEFDADGDGFGTITRGSTGDFQLSPGATPAQIGSGDILTEIVTDTTSGTQTLYTRTLSFIFNTTPALKTISVRDTAGSTHTDSPYTVSYPVPSNAAGTSQNCFRAPASGSVVADITAWRPQRPGITSAGEASRVDIGNSFITIDIPNTPCVLVGGGGCSGSGPGNCTASAYASSDSNIVTDPNGLKDSLGDRDSDPANTFSFSIDLSTCLSSAGVSWNSGESLFVDLQMRNAVGDNAAQKFCIKRD